ncbi:hypothetical protein R4511_02015 [Acinetobacter baumannii]|nr:hypothetical protein [Acinetobacter baumannii]
MNTTKIWTDLGNNSGQLQTIMAFIGIFLAFFALLYARKQIALSQAQREFEIKLKLLEISQKILKRIKDTQSKFDAYSNKVFTTFKPDPNLILNDTGATVKETLNLHNELLASPKKLALDVINSINNSKTKISIKTLEEYLKTLIGIENDLGKAEEAIEAEMKILNELGIANLKAQEILKNIKPHQ